MTALDLKGSKKLMDDHLATLRGYARRVLVHGDPLIPGEDEDREGRMHEFLAIGNSFNLTKREMVALLYQEMLTEGDGCSCPTCRGRLSRGAE